MARPNVLILDVIPATVHVEPVGRLIVERPSTRKPVSFEACVQSAEGRAERGRCVPQTASYNSENATKYTSYQL